MAVEALASGDLRHRLTIQSRVKTRSAQGGFTYAWSNINTVYAAIDPKSGREFMFAEAIRAQATHFIKMRAQTNPVTPDMRLAETAVGNYQARSFNILQVLRPREIQHTLLIAAVENLSVAESATGAQNLIVPYTTPVLDLTQVQDVAISIPSLFNFYPDEVEIICTQLVGNIVTQPTLRAGILGNLTKYLSKLTTQLIAQKSRQRYDGLGADSGETDFRLGIGTPGAVSGGGSYLGIILVSGKLL